MGNISLARRQFRQVITKWKYTTHTADNTLSPKALRFLIHPILGHRLHQAMNRECFCLGVTTNKRVLPKYRNSFLQLKLTRCNRLKYRAEITAPFSNDFLRYVIRGEKGE